MIGKYFNLKEMLLQTVTPARAPSRAGRTLSLISCFQGTKEGQSALLVLAVPQVPTFNSRQNTKVAYLEMPYSTSLHSNKQVE